jgi:ribosome modulation factor
MAFDPFTEGRNAYASGEVRSMCPYGVLATHSETLQREDWLKGYDAAEESDLKLHGVSGSF